jgi:PadR family transcriptional regulator, regulatory protein PadR
MFSPESFRVNPARTTRVGDDSLDLLKGTLDVLVLKALTWGPRHGYAVARWIEDATRGTLQVEEGALYHALHRLEKSGAVTSAWGVSESNRRAKYYTLTPAGRQRLAAQTDTWTRYAEAVFAALRTTGPATA